MMGCLLSSIVAMPFLAALALLFIAERNHLAVRWISLVGAGYSLVAACAVALLYDMDAGGFQPYALFKERMSAVDPIQSEVRAIVQTLRSGHRVWWVGYPTFLQPGEKPSHLAPAPGSPAGWSQDAYSLVWSRQAAYAVQRESSSITRVAVPGEGPVSELENVQLFVAGGRSR